VLVAVKAAADIKHLTEVAVGRIYFCHRGWVLGLR
jgi:hypothetical protein